MANSQGLPFSSVNQDGSCLFFLCEGEDIVLTIFFAERDEAMFMYEKLLIQSITIYKHTTVKLINETQIYIQCKKSKQIFMERILIPLLLEMLVNIKEKKLIIQILNQHYLFTNEVEQQQISQIATFMMKEGHPNLNNTIERRTLLKSLQKFFKEIPPTFSLDAFFQFRSKSYMDYLHKVVVLAIDEYKLELEYQKYINEVRTEIDGKMLERNIIHVYLGKENYIFDDKLCLLHTFTEKENLLKSLIELVPKQIFLYANYIDDSFTTKLLNIFQERVQILKNEDFIGNNV